MCRIAAYLGPAIALEDIIVRPPHSLLQQSQNATEAKLAVNGDGFGIAWYGNKPMPGLYRDVLPAWADDNLVSLCRMLESRLFISHVRASTIGETTRANCHPFSYRNWAFCHNGQIPHFPRIRRALEADLSDDLYAQRRGTTDSEMLFLTLLQNGLERNPALAIQRILQQVAPPAGGAPIRFTCVFSDGQTLWGGRFASDDHAPGLYMADHGQGQVLASEPLWHDGPAWQKLTQGVLYALPRQGPTRETPIALAPKTPVSDRLKDPSPVIA